MTILYFKTISTRFCYKENIISNDLLNVKQQNPIVLSYYNIVFLGFLLDLEIICNLCDYVKSCLWYEK